MPNIRSTPNSLTSIRVNRGDAYVHSASNDIKVNRDDDGLKSVHTIKESSTQAVTDAATVEALNEIYFVRDNLGGLPLPSPTFAGFGFSRCLDTQYTAQTPLAIAANTRTAVPNNCGSETDLLRAPFADYDFIQNGVIRPKASGDVFLIRLGFQIRSQLMLNNLRLELDVNGAIFQDYRQSFAQSSGIAELVTVNFLGYAAASFFTNGGRFYITTTGAASIWSISMFMIPISSGVS